MPAGATPPEQELRAWLWLGHVPGLGAGTFRKLLAEFGGPEAILAAGPAALRRAIPGPLADAIREGPDPARIDATMRWLDDGANAVVTLADADYQAPLLEITDPPPLLYIKGVRALLGRPSLAVVGSRNATAQGMENALAFSQELSDAGFAITSGLALGIDAAAHRGGMAGKSSSVAVVGTGLDVVYPARNRGLAHELSEKGLLVSEFALGTPPLAVNFPRRNRLISGLSRGCLVVEAALKSGSLITARYALEQGREVFAIPGSIHSSLSKGCHRLIKQGAKLVESSADLLEELGFAPAAAASAARTVPAEYREFLDQLGFDPADLDTLCERSGLTPETASAMLLALELEGLVGRLPGGRFQRVR
jgi:DNA processing protein